MANQFLILISSTVIQLHSEMGESLLCLFQYASNVLGLYVQVISSTSWSICTCYIYHKDNSVSQSIKALL